MEITCCSSDAAQFDVIKTFPVSAEAADTTKTTKKCSKSYLFYLFRTRVYTIGTVYVNFHDSDFGCLVLV